MASKSKITKVETIGNHGPVEEPKVDYSVTNSIEGYRRTVCLIGPVGKDNYSIMLRVGEYLERLGYMVLLPVKGWFNSVPTEHDMVFLRENIRHKIDLSSQVFVVNGIKGYIGDDTASEIEYARSSGKDVVFYTIDSSNYTNFPELLAPSTRRKVIVLVGDIKFRDRFAREYTNITFQENAICVLPPIFDFSKVSLTEEALSILNEIHLQKIRSADEVRVINENGEIDILTYMHIKYAIYNNIPVTYIESLHDNYELIYHLSGIRKFVDEGFRDNNSNEEKGDYNG